MESGYKEMKPVKNRKAGRFVKRKKKKVSEEDRKRNAARWVSERRVTS